MMMMIMMMMTVSRMSDFTPYGRGSSRRTESLRNTNLGKFITSQISMITLLHFLFQPSRIFDHSEISRKFCL